jgi:hypothetical protein
MKIIERLLMMRKYNNSNGKFELDQSSLISVLHTGWGCNINADIITDNDKLRLVCLLFHDGNIDKLHRLVDGVTNRNQLDDPNLSPRGIFENLALDFNNGNIQLSLPPKTHDIPGLDLERVNPNDETRIRIKRDCACNILWDMFPFIQI